MQVSSGEPSTIFSLGAVLVTALVLSSSSVVAGELQKGTSLAYPRKQAESTGRTVTRASLSSGAPYVCTPSGFGQKGTCVLRAGL